MSDIGYTREHEWLRLETDGSVTVGITDYAQDQLGDIVYVELPAVGAAVVAGDQIVVIESVKAVGEIALPIAGSVAAVNETLADEPERVNSEPMESGWLIRVTPAAPVSPQEFMNADTYADYIASL